MSATASKPDFQQLAADIKQWAQELGFQAAGITGIELDADETRLLEWLDRGYHGDMEWMQRHGTKRSRPDKLVPGTLRVVSVRMDYWPPQAADSWSVIEDDALGFVSRYALGRDYHKIMRKRLQHLAERIQAVTGTFGYRAFVDSAPVMEKPLARNAGLGWIGKHTNLLSTQAGSWFFLGDLYTDLPLPLDEPESSDYCGSCRRCIDICPTGAIVGPYKLDARRCISYLTIEHPGSIPEHLRPLMGNRIYGCDDCQLVCPWNKFAAPTPEPDFLPRNGLDAPGLVELFQWSEDAFYERTKGTAIRRIGYRLWLRNIAVALGNARTSDTVVHALRSRIDYPDPLVREHVEWALARHGIDARSP